MDYICVRYLYRIFLNILGLQNNPMRQKEQLVLAFHSQGGRRKGAKALVWVHTPRKLKNGIQA